MQVSSILRTVRTVLRHNSPAILTGIAVAGTATTAYLAAMAGYKAARVVALEELRLGHPISGPAELSAKERFQICWPLFMPAVGVGTMTVACVLGANHVSSRRVAALAGAYSLTESAFKEYREKVVEQFSHNKERAIRDAVAQDQITRDPPSHKEIIITPETEHICYETMSGRYFTTSVETLKQAQNTFNHSLLEQMYGSLNDYWDLIGLTGTTMGDQLGWTADSLMELHITTTLSPDGKPCLSLGYINAPKADYHKFR